MKTEAELLAEEQAHERRVEVAQGMIAEALTARDRDPKLASYWLAEKHGLDADAAWEHEDFIWPAALAFLAMQAAHNLASK